MEERGAAAATVVVVDEGAVGGRVEVSPRYVEARKKGFQGWVPVDEGGEEVGPVFHVGAEGEDEEGEEDEFQKMRTEDRARLFQDLRGGL
ncbi:hypothetical protein U1Q18_013133 [Sarracenia purpurea var. burkii]